MPEYAGKKVVAPIDFAGLTGELIGTIKDVEAKRDARKAELDLLYQNADTGVRETEQFQNQTLNTMVLDGADVVRNQMYEWNKALKSGELKPNEYRSKFNSAQQDWSMFANQAKTYDKTMLNFLERQQPGEDGKIAGSGYEQYMSGVFAGNSDLNNTSIEIGEGGKIFMTKFDNEGNTISTVDVARMTNPGNMIDNRFDLAESIKSDTDKWDNYKITTGTGRAGFTSIEDVRQNPEYQFAVDAKVQSVLSNNRSTTSVLVDNGVGGYDFYQNNTELEQAVADQVAAAKRVAKASGTTLSDADIKEIAKAKKDRMIQVKYDKTGVMQPLPTDDQYQAAKDRVVSEIEIQIGHDETKKAGFKPVARGSGGSGRAGAGDGSNLYSKLRKAWMSSDASELSSLTGDDIYFVWEKGGLRPYKPRQVVDKEDPMTGEVTYKNIGTPQGPPITSLRDMSSYYYGESDTKGQGGAYSAMQAEIREWEQSGGLEKEKGRDSKAKGESYTYQNESYTYAELSEAGWTDEQIKALK